MPNIHKISRPRILGPLAFLALASLALPISAAAKPADQGEAVIGPVYTDAPELTVQNGVPLRGYP